MNDKQLVKKIASTITEKELLTFDVDIEPTNRLHKFAMAFGIVPKKKKFVINPLTFSQLQNIAALIIDLELSGSEPTELLDAILKADPLIEVIAIAVTSSRKYPSKDLVDFLRNSLTPDDLVFLVGSIVTGMSLNSFTTAIILAKTLNIVQVPKAVDVKNASVAEMNPLDQGSTIAPGTI